MGLTALFAKATVMPMGLALSSLVADRGLLATLVGVIQAMFTREYTVGVSQVKHYGNVAQPG
ncbi:hypothetical protein [Endozoicomonas acroporae]|uniref:hypothetical protein n=1 Tax=Endozoicomonas acroporae TaxID=1701104 RepID=UPI0013D3779E|nr:hypothetical protein [Endozoicomonas acroporae]